MADQNLSKNVEEQNRRKLREYLNKLEKSGGLPAKEERKTTRVAPDRFRRDWEDWKRLYGGQVIDLSRGSPSRVEADYKLLGVSSKATQAEIKKAFYALAKKNHPDQGGKVEKFRELMGAYQRLTGHV